MPRKVFVMFAIIVVSNGNAYPMITMEIMVRDADIKVKNGLASVSNPSCIIGQCP